MASTNCLCKLKHFTIYLRHLILERSEWHDNTEIVALWPIRHDFIGITVLSCLNIEGFKFLKKTAAFGWLKYDNNEAYLKDFRDFTTNTIIINSRLNGFTKFTVSFKIKCFDGELQLIGQVHNSEEEDIDCYEMKSQQKIVGSIHFAQCGGYYQGKPVYLQYDIPRLLQAIYNVIEPIRDYVSRNWQFDSVVQYIKHIPLFISETMFNDNGRNEEKDLEDLKGDGKIKMRHTNPEKLMFLSPEMSEAQKKSAVILFHYRDDEVNQMHYQKSKLEAANKDLEHLYLTSLVPSIGYIDSGFDVSTVNTTNSYWTTSMNLLNEL